MKSKGMQKRREALHHDENGDSEERPDGEKAEQKDTGDKIAVFGAHTHPQQLAPEHLGQLRVSQRQCPQSQVRGGVRDGGEHVFDSVDALIDHQLAEGAIIMAVTVAGRRVVAGSCRLHSFALHLDLLRCISVALDKPREYNINLRVAVPLSSFSQDTLIFPGAKTN